jgi:arylsulfatase A-like enzyme
VLVLALQAAALGTLAAMRGRVFWPSIHTASGKLAAAGLSLAGLVAAWRLGVLDRAAGRAGRRIAAVAGARRVVVAMLLVVAGLGVARFVQRLAVPAARTNVVLVTVDTLRADHLGSYGYARETSPAIDRLAREGVRFDTAVTQWPKTTPSLASLHTGVYPSTNGVTRHTQQALPAAFATLAQRLSEAGYETAAVVTNGNLARAYRFDKGFDSYIETWRSPTADDPERAAHVTDAAIAWLDARRSERPFFLWVHYVDPHAPYTPPPPFDGMFVGDAHYDPSERAPLSEQPIEDIDGIPARSRLGVHDEIAYYVAQYDAEIRYSDGEIGRLFDRVEAGASGARTAIVLTADHGESLGEHRYYFEHGRLPFDGCVRVPLVVRLPGGHGGGRSVKSPVQLVDVLPTVLEIASVAVPGEAEGRSLVPLLAQGQDPERGAFAFTESGYTDSWQRSVRDARWKLVWTPDPSDRAIATGTEWALFDLATDPSETTDVAAAHPDQVERLRSALESWRHRSGVSTIALVPAPRVDHDTEERLRKLGYVR